MSDGAYYSPHEHTLDEKLRQFRCKEISQGELKSWFYDQFMKYAVRSTDTEWGAKLAEFAAILESEPPHTPA